MHRFAPIRFAAIASLALPASLSAASPGARQATSPVPSQISSTLPSTAPTTPVPPPIPLTPSQRPPTHAQVTYAGGTLSVSADNASLNQILRQISHDTGIKITGGVADERVFGHYGPAAPSQVLTELLDGTGDNMILVHRDAPAPSELILTPRQGGPTPPNPNAAAFDDRPEQPIQYPQSERTAPQPIPTSQPTAPPVSEGMPAPTSQANPSQPDSPNGVKTPQQIYEQLQRLRQQQQQTQPQ